MVMTMAKYVSHRIFVPTKRMEKFALTAIVDEHAVPNGDD